MEDIKIEIETNLKYIDLWNYYSYHYFSFNMIFYIFLGLVIFGMAILFMLFGDSFEITQFFGLLAISLLFSMVYVFLLVYTTTKGLVNNNNAVKYIISNEQMEAIGENLSSEIKWDYFSSIKEKKNYFFLHAKRRNQMMIPKRDFQNEEELSEFKELLREKFEDEAQLITSKRKLGLK